MGDGAAALQAVHEHLADLVLSAVVMPHVGGFELLTGHNQEGQFRQWEDAWLAAHLAMYRISRQLRDEQPPG